MQVQVQDQVNILLVDDQPAKLLSYEVILSELGENLIKANSAREALEQLLKTEVAVILLDVSMPELDGWEALKRLRELSDVPVLMFSGTKPEPEQLELLRPGRDAFREKPFFGTELVGVVDELLDAA